jgi:hypothetical protein
MTEFEMKMKQAQKAVGLGKLSRRDFMSFAMSVGITAVAANTMFATAPAPNPRRAALSNTVRTWLTTDSLDPPPDQRI